MAVVHADEALLSELDNKWNSVNLQTSWVLQHCSKPADTASPTNDCSTDGSDITSKTSTELAVDTNPSPPSSPPEPESTQLNYPDPATPTSSTFLEVPTGEVVTALHTQ